MALQFIGENSVPAYIALSSDIGSSTIPGIALVGKLVLTTDDGYWYIIKKDLTLTRYYLPVSATINTSDLEIGAVELKNAADDTRAKVGVVSGLASSDNGLPTASLLLAGEAHVGAVGGSSVIANNTPTLTVHATYVTGDYVGTSGSPMTFTGCARLNAGTGIITGATLIDYALQSVSGELWIFDTIITPPDDSAAWTLSDAHAATCLGVIPFSTYYASAANSVSFGLPASPIVFKCGASVKELYGCFVTRGSPAYASGDLTFRLNVWQD